MSIDAVLFHGTRYPRAVLRDNRIRLPATGYAMVSLTRSSRVARHWATLARDDDEGLGAILVLNRSKLQTRYRLTPFRDESWFGAIPRTDRDEAEEVIFGRALEKLSEFLLEVRWHPSA